jgi:regulatory protein
MPGRNSRRQASRAADDEHEDPALAENREGGADGAAGDLGEQARTAEPARTAEQARTDDPGERARQVCLRLLTLAPRTRAQLADALRKRGVPDDTADEVLSRFEDVGLIDDAAFARAWVESRHYSRGLAGRALSAELKQRGVAADEIRAAIDERLGPDAEVSAARRLIDRKLESTRGLPPEQRTRRLAGMLARKGYPAGLAFRVIREALGAEGDLVIPEDEPAFDEADSDTE